MTSQSPDHLLVQTITIERPTTTVGADGSPQLSWSTHLASIRARLRPVRPRQTTDAARVVTRRRWTIYVDAEHDISSTDRVTHGSETLWITGILDHGGSGTIKAIHAEESHA